MAFFFIVKDYTDEYANIEHSEEHLATFIRQTIDQLFDDFDGNKDGELDAYETRRLVKSILKEDEELRDDKFAEMFEYFDKNSNGVLERDEIEDFVKALYRGNYPYRKSMIKVEDVEEVDLETQNQQPLVDHDFHSSVSDNNS